MAYDDLLASRFFIIQIVPQLFQKKFIFFSTEKSYYIFWLTVTEEMLRCNLCQRLHSGLIRGQETN